METKQPLLRKSRRSRKGQSVVEFALASLLIALLLAAAVDFGRIFYTYVVVLNMAGEGATILAFYPNNDLRDDFHPPSMQPQDSFERRAQQVAARAMGRVISSESVGDDDVQLLAADGTPMPQTEPRCHGTAFRIAVNYNMRDLFFPALLGFQYITINTNMGSTFAVSGRHCPHL